MWPLRFVMPHDPSMRPVWMIRAGFFLYDHLAKREVLAGSRTIDLRSHPSGAPLKPQYARGFVYSDGWVDDARLVVLNARDAADTGRDRADALALQRCAARRHRPGRVTLQSEDGQVHALSARALVNAAGPVGCAVPGRRGRMRRAPARCGWSRAATSSCASSSTTITPTSSRTPTSRIIFAIPYQDGDFTLIGTTDVEHHGAIGEARIDASEIAYLCEQASRYFARPVQPADVVWSYSGVRPLLDDESGDPSAVTRDYSLELDATKAPLLSVWGGKITTFRKLAEEAADLLCAAAGEHARRLDRGGLPARRRPGRVDRRPAAPRHRLRPLRARVCAAPPRPARRRCAHRLARCYGSRVSRRAAGGRAQGPRSRPACTRPNCTTCTTTNGPAARTTCCGAAPSSACT